MKSFFPFNIHPWLGTQHCYREKDEDGFQYCNDHTGCLYNDGNNECMHPAREEIVSPLLTKEE